MTGWDARPVETLIYFQAGHSMDAHLKALNHSLRENDMSKTQGKKPTREERKAEFLKKLDVETLQVLKGCQE